MQVVKPAPLKLFFFKRLYLFIHERHTEAETQAEGEAGFLRGAQCRTPSQDPVIMTGAEGRHSTTELAVLNLQTTQKYGD